jgi:hypothetical protein
VKIFIGSRCYIIFKWVFWALFSYKVSGDFKVVINISMGACIVIGLFTGNFSESKMKKKKALDIAQQKGFYVIQ